jgi:acetyltransferase-like isoleucine patch superfamily enzyme
MNVAYQQFEPVIAEFSKISKTRVTIGEFTVVDDFAYIDSGENPNSLVTIGRRCHIKRGTTIKSYNGFVNIGNRVSIGEYCIIAGHGGLIIGDATIIAGQCCISAANHIFTTDNYIRFQGEEAKGITIGKDVWIGAGVIVLDGISIGDSSIIGAGSIVTKDIPSNTKCFGNPCRIIKERIPWRLDKNDEERK